ncbi:MAG: hypothetical protein AAGJ52_05650, partial [Pseudomonadota bacterium]
MTRHLLCLFLFCGLLAVHAAASAQSAVLEKSYDAARVELGQITQSTWTVTNTGTVTLENVTYSETYPPGLVVADPNGFSVNCGSNIFNDATSINAIFPLIDPGETCIFQLDLEAIATGLQLAETSELTFDGGSAPAAQASIVIADPGTPVFLHSYDAATVEVGEVTTVNYLIDGTALAAALTNLAFTHNLPEGLALASPTTPSSTCGGALNLQSDQIRLLNGSLAAGSTCLVSVDVVGTALGEQQSVIDALLSNAGSSGGALATIEVIDTPLPLFTQTLGANQLNVGDVTTLRYTLTNTSAVNDLQAVSFNHSFPTGFTTDLPGNLTTDCVGSTNLQLNSFSFNGSLAAAMTCTLEFDIAATTPGRWVSSTSTLNSELGDSAAAEAIVTINDVGAPGFSKQFSPAETGQQLVTALTFTIDNTANAAAADFLEFTDSLPAGLIVASPSNVDNSCSGGVVTAVEGSDTIAYTGGSVASGSSCSISVDILPVASGLLENLTSDLSSTAGASGAAFAQLLVTSAPSFSKAFGETFLSPGGVTSLTYSLLNQDSMRPATGLAFTHTLPAGLQLASPANAFTNCPHAGLTASDGGNSVDFNGGALDPGTLCSVTVNVEAIALGVQNSATSPLASSLGIAAPAVASLEGIGGLSWISPVEATWFDTINWSPAILPNAALNVAINQGGTALVPADSDDPEALRFDLGVDGGTGTLRFEEDFGLDLNVAGDANIGVTFNGSATSTGTLTFDGDNGGGIQPGNQGALRIGVSQAKGDASGTYLVPDRPNSQSFSSIQIGVAEADGSVDARVELDSSTGGLIANDGPMEIGVARSNGSAVAVLNGGEIDGVASANIGVAEGSGTASAEVDIGFDFDGTNTAVNQGPVNIGVSFGSGSAVGNVRQQLDVFSNTAQLRRFTELNVGVANGTGSATGSLLNAHGIEAPLINVGLNPGGGVASGSLFVDHGLIQSSSLNLG